MTVNGLKLPFDIQTISIYTLKDIFMDMQRILIRLHEDEAKKLKEIANSNGHLTKSAMISQLIAQFGNAPSNKLNNKLQKSKAEDKIICDMCAKEVKLVLPIEINNKEVKACEKCIMKVTNSPDSLLKSI